LNRSLPPDQRSRTTLVVGVPKGSIAEGMTFDDIQDQTFLTWIPLPATPGWFRIDITDLFNKWSTAVSPTPASF
jgi:hypothetical protein